MNIDGNPTQPSLSSAQLDPEELKHIHEVFNGTDDIPHEADEDAEPSELSHEQVKSHTDNAVEDETNSSLYDGQHLPE